MEMKVKIRRIIGITALVLWVIAIVPKIILDHNSRLVWQLDNWAFMIAPIFTIAYAVLLTIYIANGKHWAIKSLVWIGCGVISLVCIGVFFIAGVFQDYKIWGNKDYVVYDEFGGFGDPSVYVLYQRKGILDERMYIFRLGVWKSNGARNEITSADYLFCEPLDLIKEETDVVINNNDSAHITTFYRLSNGSEFDQSQNDSLLRLINKSQ